VNVKGRTLDYKNCEFDAKRVANDKLENVTAAGTFNRMHIY